MSLLDLMKTKTDIARWGGRHPIMSFENADRNSRDAYYYGLVLGTIVDDKKVDQSEKALLDKVGYALGYSKFSVADVVDSVLSLNESERFLLLEEVTGIMRGTGLEKCFMAEFTFMWISHGGNKETLVEWRDQLEQRLASSFDEKVFLAFDRLTMEPIEDLSELKLLADGFPECFLEYIFADKYQGGFSALVSEAHKKADHLKDVAKEKADRQRADAETESKKTVEAFYRAAKNLIDNVIVKSRGVSFPSSPLASFLAFWDNFEKDKDKLGVFTTIDLTAAIQFIAGKYRESVLGILQRKESAGGLSGGMCGVRISDERERLVGIIACLAVMSGRDSPQANSMLRALRVTSLITGLSSKTMDDETCFWNEHVKPALQKIFNRKD